MSFDLAKILAEAQTDDLRELCRIAKGTPRSFFRGANFSKADLRGQDLRGFDLTGADFRLCGYDETTMTDADFRERLRQEGIDHSRRERGQSVEFVAKLRKILESERTSETLSWIFRGRETDRATLESAERLTDLVNSMRQGSNRAVVYVPPLLLVKTGRDDEFSIFAKNLTRDEQLLLDRNPNAKTDPTVALEIFAGFETLIHKIVQKGNLTEKGASDRRPYPRGSTDPDPPSDPDPED